MIIKQAIEGFKTIKHDSDFCVVGGGISGLISAIAAARNGAKVVLMHDRPVFGGNASSEVRMWIRGARGKNMRETGILEELALENIYRNPDMNFSIWDSVLYEKAYCQENLEIILNCSCCDARVNNNTVMSIKGWQTTTQTWHEVKAKIFADCSGDSILAPITGAKWCMGREGKRKYCEEIAPEKSDNHTMGMSCLFQARQSDKPIKFIPPKFANRYTIDDFPLRLDLSTPNAWCNDNYWWIELGGTENTINDTEDIRERLLKIAFGVWDFIKNSGHCDSEYWDLEWIGFVAGKRESRRYVGDYVLNQNDITAGGHFDDIVAYGGWPMDDHHPSGFLTNEAPTIFHNAPSPYGIPYRCLYSCNINNLMFAGRNISTTHTALSSTRVMATCGILGQAVGTAAAIAVKENLLPRDIYLKKIKVLQQTLMKNDCYLPFLKKEISALTKSATITSTAGNYKMLLNGIERPSNGEENAWIGAIGDEIVFDFRSRKNIKMIRIVFDSDLNRQSWKDVSVLYKDFPMRCNIFSSGTSLAVPETLVRSFSIEADNGDGIWRSSYTQKNNYQRLVLIDTNINAKRIKFVPQKTWGSKIVRIFAFEVS